MSEREHHLILRYLEGHQTPGEKQEFELWLTESAGNPELVESYRKIWDASADTIKGDHESETAWNQFAAAVQLDTKTTDRRLAPIVKVAAAILVLVVASAVVYVMFFRTTRVELRSAEAPIQATLPDGSQVWLNENTTISYNSDFNNDRSLELSGEAFFDVQKDSQHPFVITAGKGTVQVVGTSFNVNATTKDSLSVYVVTGVVSLAMDHAVELTSGQRGTVTSTNTPQVMAPDPNDIAWKTKQLVFSKATLENVARRLRTYFKKDIRVGSDSLAVCRFTGSFDNPTLDEVLETLSFALDIKVARDPNGYMITGAGCNTN